MIPVLFLLILIGLLLFFASGTAALPISEMATACGVPSFCCTIEPYWTKSVPVSWSAVTLN